MYEQGRIVMDVVLGPKSKWKRLLWWGMFLFVLLTGAIWLSYLKPAAVEVERQSLYIDVVKRGEIVFQVRGSGTLVPVDVRLITAQVPCKVERIHMFPGASVSEDSVIAELSSPELQQATDDALWQMRRAEADYEVDRLNQLSALNTARANAEEAKASLLASQRLQKAGLQSDLDVLRAKAKAEDVIGRLSAEEARMKLYNEGRIGQLAPARARLEQAKALYNLKRQQKSSLVVRAGMIGILQQVPLQVGQQLVPGASIAKVAKSSPLKAELKVSENLAKDLQVGQSASIDTRNGIVQGKVIRIDPAVINGTVTVDSSLEGDLPRGARPDLSIEGTIDLDHLGDALYLGRPVQAQPHASISVFRLSPDNKEAVRVKVKLGRTSVSTVEILEGLKPGDQVIISDVTQYDGIERIMLK